MNKETYKDTDLRDALRRKYSETPQLPTDFMSKMQEQLQTKASSKRSPWRWVAAAACILAVIGLGVTMLPKEHTEQTKDRYAQTNIPQKTDIKPTPEEQHFSIGQTHEVQEKVQQPIATTKTNKPIVAKVHIPTETSPSTAPSPSTEIPVPNNPGKDTHLLYASQSLTEDTTYQAPSRMDEFIAKIAEYNKVKAVPLDCTSDRRDNAVVNTAYVFQDTKELDLFARLFQAACWYDSKVPGYLLNFSQQQFFFTLKDLRKGDKYLWIAERIDGGRILLFCTHSPIEANISSACYQKYREQLTHTYGTLQF